MSAKQDFLKAIWEQPHDDLPRLVYADWLEDQGYPARAEFIRMQCEYARTEKYEDHWYTLAAQIEKLWNLHGPAWKKELPEAVRLHRFERGFVLPQPVRRSAADFMAMPAEQLAAAPLWQLATAGDNHGLVQACHHPHARSLQALYHFSTIEEEDLLISGMFDSTCLNNLSSLSLSGRTVSDDTVRALCNHAHHLPLLNELEMSWTRISDKMLKSFAKSEIMSRLTSLTIKYISLKLDGLAALVKSANVSQLKALAVNVGINVGMGDNDQRTKIESRMLSIIMKSTALKNLRHLAVTFNSSDTAIETIVKSQPIFELYSCSLIAPSCGSQHYARFLKWPGLKSVRELALYYCEVTLELAHAIATTPTLKHLRKLTVHHYKHSDQEAARKLIRDRFGSIDDAGNDPNAPRY